MSKLSRTDAEAFAAWKVRMDKLHAESRKLLDESAECLERMRVRREAAETSAASCLNDPPQVMLVPSSRTHHSTTLPCMSNRPQLFAFFCATGWVVRSAFSLYQANLPRSAVSAPRGASVSGKRTSASSESTVRTPLPN